MKSCLECGDILSAGKVYCSNKCQGEYQYKQFIVRWQNGEEHGGKGIYAKSISNHVRRYLLAKFKYACTQCGWGEKNLFSGTVPLEIDHIDGNSDNNHEDNLRVLCPNCHSLTPNFRNLNRGSGRAWRRLKYMKSDI